MTTEALDKLQSEYNNLPSETRHLLRTVALAELTSILPKLEEIGSSDISVKVLEIATRLGGWEEAISYAQLIRDKQW